MSEEECLRILGRYIVRNAYTGASSLDAEAIEVLRRAFRSVWNDGYEGGLDDGISDCTVEQAHRNPYV